MENWRKHLNEEHGYKRDEGENDKPPFFYKKGEDSPKEELGSEARACVAEQTDIILGDLKKVLEKWEEGEYDSDEDRWQEYAKDVQGLVDQYEGEDEPAEHTEEECEEVHPDQTHEEWEAEKEEKGEEEEEEGEKEEHDPGFMPGHAHSKSIGSESKPKKKSKSKKKEKGEESREPTKAGKGGNNFPYESKQLEQMVYQKLITALGGEE